MTWLTQPSKQTRRHKTHKQSPSVPTGWGQLRAGLGTPWRAGVGGLGCTGGLCAGVASCGLVALVLTLRSLLVEVVGRRVSVPRRTPSGFRFWTLRLGERVLCIPLHHFLWHVHGGFLETFRLEVLVIEFWHGALGPQKRRGVLEAVCKADLRGVRDHIQHRLINGVLD